MLRSILAQLHYQYEIMEWERKGVPFQSRLYVPEIHPITGIHIHEREDETHVFKVRMYTITNYPSVFTSIIIIMFSVLVKV